MSVESIEIQNVLCNFPELINSWCESNYKVFRKKPEDMCVEAIHRFSGLEINGEKLTQNRIRSMITFCSNCSHIHNQSIKNDNCNSCNCKKYKPKFKKVFRRNNANIGILKRLGNLENSIKENLYQPSYYQDKKK